MKKKVLLAGLICVFLLGLIMIPASFCEAGWDVTCIMLDDGTFSCTGEFVEDPEPPPQFMPHRFNALQDRVSMQGGFSSQDRVNGQDRTSMSNRFFGNQHHNPQRDSGQRFAPWR